MCVIIVKVQIVLTVEVELHKSATNYYYQHSLLIIRNGLNFRSGLLNEIAYLVINKISICTLHSGLNTAVKCTDEKSEKNKNQNITFLVD